MSDVKRYNGNLSTGYSEYLMDDGSGWVRGHSYDALASRLAEAERREAQAHELRNQIAAENKRLFAKVVEAEQDAARYRVIRELAFKSGGDLVIELIGAYDKHTGGNFNEGVDAAIDAQLAALSPRHQSAEGAEGEGT